MSFVRVALQDAVKRERETASHLYAFHAGIPLLIAAAILSVFEMTDLDRRIQDLFYDPIARGFPHRLRWLYGTLIHDFGKLSVIVVGALLLAGLLLSFRRASLVTWRRPFVYGVLSIALCPVVVRYLKHTTGIHCPRALSLYGGSQPYLRITERLLHGLPAGYEPGHCWPGGHASSGFALMSLYFVFRRRWPRMAVACLVGGFLYGFMLGFGRVVYGAHFISHNLWSAVVCWMIALVLYELVLRQHSQAE